MGAAVACVVASVFRELRWVNAPEKPALQVFQMSNRRRSQDPRRVAAMMLVGLILLTSEQARADVPFVLVFLHGRVTQWTGLLVSLLIELLVLRRYFDMTWGRAIGADLLMNAVSTIAGVVFFPFPVAYIYSIFVFTPALWVRGELGSLIELVGTLFVAALIDAAIELGILRWAFLERVNLRRIIALFTANLASAVVIVGSFWLQPPH